MSEQRAVWSEFWRGAAIDGCTLAFPAPARAQIADGWRTRLSQDHKGRLLDVACGKGAVLALARALGFAEVTGVDIVALDTLGDAGSAIIGGVDAAALPFADASFDVVVSQFGIEYAGLDAAGAEAARVCGERLLLLTHAAEGIVVAHAREQVAQARWLAEQGATARLIAHFTTPSTASCADIDRLLAASAARAQDDENITLLESFYRTAVAAQDATDPLRQVSQLSEGIVAHAGRMGAMIDAAPTQAALEALAHRLEAQGFAVTITEEGPPLIGRWLEAGR